MKGRKASAQPPQSARGKAVPYPAEKAPGGEFILRPPQRMLIFVAGLTALFSLALLLRHLL